jgi:hypothetical protein
MLRCRDGIEIKRNVDNLVLRQLQLAINIENIVLISNLNFFSPDDYLSPQTTIRKTIAILYRHDIDDIDKKKKKS